MKNDLAFIRDRFCHLTFCLHMMEPHSIFMHLLAAFKRRYYTHCLSQKWKLNCCRCCFYIQVPHFPKHFAQQLTNFLHLGDTYLWEKKRVIRAIQRSSEQPLFYLILKHNLSARLEIQKQQVNFKQHGSQQLKASKDLVNSWVQETQTS